MLRAGDISDGKGFNRTEAQVAQEASASATGSKRRGRRKKGMPGFVGILCALLPLLTAAIYLVGMRYYHGYLDRFGLEYTEFSQPADVTLFHGFLLLLQLLLPLRVPSRHDSWSALCHALMPVFQGEVALDSLMVGGPLFCSASHRDEGWENCPHLSRSIYI